MENDLKFELNYLKRADGSCLYADKETTVIASVFGPGDLKVSKQIADKALCEVNFKTTVCSQNAPRDTNFESLLTKTCESVVQTTLHPRSLLSITVQQLHDDGNLKSAAVNAVCLALLDAGLPMKCTFVAVTVILTPEHQLIIRPSAKQENLCLANFTFVLYSTEPGNIAGSLSEGVFSMEIFKKASELAKAYASELFPLIRRTIQKKLTRQFIKLDDVL